MTRFIVPTLAFLAACGGGKDSNQPAAFECGEVAIQTLDGQSDDCDVQACQACVDACGGGCMVLESFPPQYACEGEGSWSVYDFCDDWSMPEYLPCDDATSTVGWSDATALGFSGDDVIAALAGPFDSDAQWVAEEGRPDTVVHLAITADASDPTFHDRSESTQTTTGVGVEADPGCPDYLEVPVTLTLQTDDGAFDETLSTSLWVMELANLSAGAELDWQALDGSFQFATIVPADWDDVAIDLSTTLTPALSGQVQVAANRDLGGGMGEGMVGPLLRWPPQ